MAINVAFKSLMITAIKKTRKREGVPQTGIARKKTA